MQLSFRSLALAVIALNPGCDSRPSAAGQDLELAPADTIVPAGSPVFAGPSEITVDPNGLLFVTDFDAKTILVLDSMGSVLRTIGRSGAGPGEFGRPRGARVLQDTLRVLDDENGRIALFTSDGQFIRVEPMPQGANAGILNFCPQGGALLALNGRYGALAQRIGPNASHRQQFGAVVAPAPDAWNFTAIKQEIFDGRVPAVLRNMTRPVCGADGAAWLILEAEARLERYSPADSLQWRRTLDEPEFAVIKAEFFAANRRDSAGFRFTTLSYVADAQEVTAQLWLLLREPASAPAAILVFDPAGVALRKLQVPGAHGIRRFAVDALRRRLYLLAQDEAVILRAALPAAAVAQPNPALQLTRP
ncbi:MAG TPA: 6-bladed beta-propeller [Anaerolineales bacterium]|nr:6-bladed beta-propeller [Anaerolineales bacterium]